MFNDIAYLCKETITQDEYLNEKLILEEREVFVDAKSVGMSEFYTAATTDFHQDITLVLADYYDYDGEKIVRYDGKLYDLVRTYEKRNRLELVLQERIGRETIPLPEVDTTLTAKDEADILEIYGVEVSDLQENVKISERSITGTSKYAESVATFDMSLGHHFIVLHITAEGADKIEACMDPSKGSGLVELDETGVVIFQMKDDKSERVKIVVTRGNDSEISLFDISRMTFEEEE